MATYLVCSSPIHGHVTPMVAIAADLARRGHHIVMLTGSRFRDRIEAEGVGFRPLTGLADFDDSDPAEYLPERDRHKQGLDQAQYDIQTIFIRPMPDQLAAVRAAIAEERPDAILVEGAFAGVSPLLLDPDAVHPPILAVGVLPLAQMSRDVAPHGMGLPPARGPLGRMRNLALNALARRVLFRGTQRLAERLFDGMGAPPLRHFIMDVSTAYDRFLQLNSAAFEYPRSDLGIGTRFIGPLPPVATDGELPEWWGDLESAPRVVHVSQGTIDNHDLGRLIRPTIDGLADTDALVVVSTGGRDPGVLGPLPANVRVAPYLPYDRLMPLVDVYVTNGGFGGVQQALGLGVPLVVAGKTEDKPEIAARVAWTGAGVDLRTGTPSAVQVRDAVRRVLDDPSFRLNAAEQREAIRGCRPFDAIDLELAAAVRRATPTDAG